MNHQSNRIKSKLAAASLSLVLAVIVGNTSSFAQTINWGTTGAVSNHNYLSDGSSALPIGVTAELGWFAADFVPSEPSTWAGAWNALDSATHNDTNGFAGFNFDAAISGSLDAIPQGENGFIWIQGESPSEMILLTSGEWSLNTIGELDVVTWTTGSARNLQVIWGAVDQSPLDPSGGLMVGSEKAPDQLLVDGSFHLQTATWAGAPPTAPDVWISQAGDFISLHWDTELGKIYNIEQSDDLEAWIEISGMTRVGSGASVTELFDRGNKIRKFYRVTVQQGGSP